MKSVIVRIPIHIDLGTPQNLTAVQAEGGTKQQELSFFVNVPDHFTRQNILSVLSERLERAIGKYVDFGKDE